MLVARRAGCLGAVGYWQAVRMTLGHGRSKHPKVAAWARSGVKVSLIDTAQDEDRDIGAAASMTIYVCITCRRPGDPEDGARPGVALARETKRVAHGSGVTVKQIRCLANCNRACSAAIRRDGAWTYVFGGLEPERDAPALIEGAKLFERATDGLMPWRGRPDILKRGLIARVPPIDFEEESE